MREDEIHAGKTDGHAAFGRLKIAFLQMQKNRASGPALRRIIIVSQFHKNIIKPVLSP